MFAEIRHRIPSLSAWMESCYACQPFLLLGTDSIRSCVGVQQGDPLGPLGFALTLHPLIEKIRAEVPGLFLNAWYLDDGTLIGSPEDLATALRIVERDGPSLGLHLNRGKSLLFILEDADASLSPLPPDIPISRRGFSLLGCPIGPPDFCEEVFQARLAKLKVSLGALRDMGDSQLETTLIRSCLALLKVSYVLRACPPSHICRTSVDFDKAIRVTLESILGGPISDWSWLKASIHSCKGGLGLRSDYMPQLLFWPPAQLLNPLWSGYLATLLALHPTPALLCLLLLLPQPILTGRPWTISMSPCISALSLSLSMRLVSSDSSHLPLPSALAPWPSPPVCTMLGTGSAWCRQFSWASTSKTENSGAACGIGLGPLSSATRSPALNAVALLTSSVTIRLVVVAMVTASLAITPLETWSSLLPSPLPWPPPRRLLVWCLTLCRAQQTSSSPTGAVVALPLWTSILSALSSSSL